MNRWIGGVLLGVVAIALLVGGCGEGSEASSSLTKAEFVKQADAACAERKEKWKGALASYRKEVKAKGVENELEAQLEIANELVRDSLLPALNSQLEQLEELGVPEGSSEKQYEKMLQALSSGSRDLEDKGAEALAESKFATFEKHAQALGVSCPL